MSRVGEVLVETYRIDRLIAEGGMGSIYEATHLRVPKRFAVKFLRVSLMDNTEALRRFRREAEVIASLDHPNIVNLIDYNVTTDGVPYIVLEFLDGEHLGVRIARGKLSIPDTLRVVEQVASALEAAHAREVIHRDLKPENIILGRKDAVKVVDFGVAKLHGATDLTAFNAIVGTVPYMAPEQLMSNPVDARCDQFGLAAITYEMLTGRMAFGGSNSVGELALRVLRHQPLPIEGVPSRVSEVVLRGLSKEADARFESIAVFLAALREAATGPRTSSPFDHDVTLVGDSGGGRTSLSSSVTAAGEIATETALMSTMEEQTGEITRVSPPRDETTQALPTIGRPEAPIVSTTDETVGLEVFGGDTRIVPTLPAPQTLRQRVDAILERARPFWLRLLHGLRAMPPTRWRRWLQDRRIRIGLGALVGALLTVLLWSLFRR